MASRKDPPAETPPSADTLAGQPLDVLIEVFATAAGQLQGLKGADLKRHIANLTSQVQQLAAGVNDKVREEAQRKEAAQEARQLLDTFARTGTEAAKVIEAQREPLARAIQNLNLAEVADGIRLLADWMSNPTPESEAKAKAVMDTLAHTMGPSVGYDPEREEQQRREQIKADVRKSLDEIFKPKKYDFSTKPATTPSNDGSDDTKK